MRLQEQINNLVEMLGELKAKEPLLNDTEKAIVSAMLEPVITKLEDFIMNLS
jgi:hypothetical protein